MTFTIARAGLASLQQPIGDGIYSAQISDNKDKKNPLQCGTFKADPGKGTSIEYTFNAFIVVLEGEFTVEDLAEPGHTSTLKANDVITIHKGSRLKWLSENGAKTFYVIEKPHETSPSDYVREHAI